MAAHTHTNNARLLCAAAGIPSQEMTNGGGSLRLIIIWWVREPRDCASSGSLFSHFPNGKVGIRTGYLLPI